MPEPKDRRIIFRADASSRIGSGHVTRCLALAATLKAHEFNCHFVCRALPGDLSTLVRDSGFSLSLLETSQEISQIEDARLTIKELRSSDMIIIDHYELDRTWEEAVSGSASLLLAIDDLANRPHATPVLLDQNFLPRRQEAYGALIPSSSLLLCGPKFALLRPEFHALRAKAPLRSGRPRRLLVFFGGADPTEETEKVMEGLQALSIKFEVNVVVGLGNSARERVRTRCEQMRYAYHCQTTEIGKLMLDSDLCLGACGSSTWERCCLMLPTVAVAVSNLQVEVAEYCHQQGVHHYLGTSAQTSPEQYAQVIQDFVRHPEQLFEMSLKTQGLCDGLGANRVAAILTEVMNGSSKN